MDAFLDRAWEQISIFLENLVLFLDGLASPLERFGPGVVIFVLAFFTVLFTRFMSRIFVTQRYRSLEKEFEHWQGVRQEAMKHPDPEKGKALARNIDQARLNRVYYDYFFEGLLKGLFTNILPILLMAAHVTTVYTPGTLLERFGDQWVLTADLFGTRVNFSSMFWFVVCVIFSFVIYGVFKISIHAWKKRAGHDSVD
ncbi:hypothetical protein [Desulfospira joergensenii]|uniref:hypothetical protein n=1 Tax=Desulfospira joergensenii TaxID=53329 RepID=UPI0003B3B8CC|nr:hypothetical protein [Desulfospira joergensenii]